MMDITLPAFPAQALRDRLGPHPENHPWAAYLPAAMCVVGNRPSSVASPTSMRNSRTAIPSSFADNPAHRSSDAGCLDAIHGRVWSLSRDPQGCRLVQRALDMNNSNNSTNGSHKEPRCAKASSQIASELRGHIPDALRCPHANHVVQKLISVTSPDESQFIIDELSQRPENIVQAARHKYGCRIVQRLIEHCHPQQTRDFVDTLFVTAVATCKHPYGNYVMQHLLKHGTEDQRLHLLRSIQANIEDIGQDNYGCAVINAAMSVERRDCQLSLARSILRTPGLLQFMARARHGHLAAKLIFQTLPDGAEREAVRACLAAEIEQLRCSRFGSSLAAELGLAQVNDEGKATSAF